jgi:hypothetical protein
MLNTHAWLVAMYVSNFPAVCLLNMLWPNVCPSAGLPEAMAACPPLVASGCLLKQSLSPFVDVPV